LVEYAFNDICTDASVAPNSARSAITILTRLGFISKDGQGSGHRPNIYRICLSQDRPQYTVELMPSESTWQKTTAAKQPSNESPLLELDFIKEDINSLSTVNPNAELDEKSLGQLARRVCLEVLAKRAKSHMEAHKWFPSQIKMLKELLLSYRTEQVVAAIVYWTTIKPPPNGLTSVKYLTYKSKNGSTKLMEALDYYKAEYMSKVAPVLAKQKVQEEIARKEKARQDALARQEADRQRVEKMDDRDFLDSLIP
jgi:hypothetical protein